MNYYDEIAEGYDELHGEEQKAKARIIINELAINPSDSLLDVGCGTGIATNLFPCRKTGIDPSKELLKKCSFPVVKGKAEELPFPNNSFDIVICLTAIHHCDVNRALEEIFRVAKRDVVISVLKKVPSFSGIEQSINKYKPYKRIEQEHDVIFFLRKALNK